MIDIYRWDRIHLRKALDWARESKDPNTKVGAVIAGPDRETRSTGFNGFPRGIADTSERLNDRDMKLRIIVHAERNAMYAAARVGIPLKGCTMYVACTDDTGDIWGGSPCVNCSIGIIQAGIVEVVSYPFKNFSKWKDDLEFGRKLLQEAGLRFREVSIT
jgi:dCMP deaminase